jgi:hypothetical protein
MHISGGCGFLIEALDVLRALETWNRERSPPYRVMSRLGRGIHELERAQARDRNNSRGIIWSAAGKLVDGRVKRDHD